MSYKLLGEGVMILEESFDAFRDVEAIVFDCDGTIIDSRSSYRLADKITACIILEKLCGIECRFGKDFDDAIMRLEMLGGFNNDWDKTSAIIQAIFLHLREPPREMREIGRIEDIEEYLERCLAEESSPEDVRAGIEWIRVRASERYGRYMALKDLEEVLDEEAERRGRLQRLNELREIIDPSAGYGSGLLPTLYDEIYLGEEGVRQRHGSTPRYVSWAGLLDREKVVITRETLETLLRIVPRGLALATGRGRWETEKVLGDLIEYFDLSSSIFSAEDPSSYEKPSPRILLECSKRLKAWSIAYVGDSFEDLLLVEKAVEEGLDAFFIGVLTNPYSMEIFMQNKADAIIEDVNSLPRVLKREEKLWSPF